MKQSVGILLYRIRFGEPEYFLVHPGGPYFARKDEGWWTIPKGELLPGEDFLTTALREFEEETGYKPEPPYLPLTPITQKGGKKVYCWAVQGNVVPEDIVCNTFEIIWPPKSGIKKSFPEVDKAGWFTIREAVTLINERQAALLYELETHIKSEPRL